ncbi:MULTISPECIES: beta-L-arabinofuranosidase domain-containing protein [Actinosynnema]|uniref:beta-L-arabinofuranosidase domain-containing protein n=1 Tax=Actinosynnema TaxID=40566 RepID=UPI0020A2D422|nr:beta-L-arabinofuranosidase domain-containing protein [Actinosynnema pretiosum]
MPLPRRGFLLAGGLAATAPLVGAGAASAAPASPTGGAPNATAAAAASATAAARPALDAFRLDQVALHDGLLADKRELVLAHARGYDVNRLVQVFRANANLPTLGAVAPGGWEGLDGEANGNLRGHYTGHFLSMLAQAGASTGERVFTDKIDTIVGALHDSRAALRAEPGTLAARGRFGGAVEHQRGCHQYVELPALPTERFTFAAWVKPTHASNWARVLDFGDDDTRYLYLAARNGNGVPRFAITATGPGGEQGVDAPNPLPVGEWSHLALTVGDGSATLYVDGAPVGGTTVTTPLTGLAHHWLGRSHFAADPVFAGAFDEISVWSRVLAPDEVAAAAGRPADGDVAAYPCDEAGPVLRDLRGRDAPVRRTWGAPSHPGFLAAYPETQFITLESMTSSNYQVVWAPYYTAHKILRGLLDAHTAIGDPRALDLADGMGDWMHSRLSRLTPQVRQRMWSIFSSGEFGGVAEAVVDLHARTGKPEHLALARMFDLDSLIDACAENRDVLTGLHANQHIPVFTGLVRLHEATGERRYLDAARNFWDMVVPRRLYRIGGTSTGEFWRAPGAIAETLAGDNAETCCAHNMLKLGRALFRHEPDVKYAEYGERALFNQILGSKQDSPSADVPLMTYFIGLAPGSVRDFTPKQGATCCEGTGLESATKYQDSVYFHDAESLYVNLFAPTTAHWNGTSITQETGFPFEQGTSLRIGGRGGRFTIKVRVPSWARGSSASLNGRPIAVPAAGSYLSVAREWRRGDVLRLRTPFRLVAEPTPDRPEVQALGYGPVHLVARDARAEFLELALHRHASLSGDLSRALGPISGKPLHFTIGGIEFAPFHEGTADPFHSYFRRVEPVIAFGGVDSGVPNENGFLDRVWEAAPFPDRGAFLRHVHRLTREHPDRARIRDAAERGRMSERGVRTVDNGR